jgi:2-polyprenyl-3-methyl-5-hydroxy-6-metoxy-1,4-benzoquinol methylase
MTAPVPLESAPCPHGCAAGDAFVVRGRDRLNQLPGEFSVVKCLGCGLMRTSPRPTPSAMSFYYPDSYSPYLTTRVEGKAGSNGAAPARRAGLMARLLDPQNHPLPAQPAGRLLEIGCGSGAFLHHMARGGWDVEGLEFSPTAAAAARALGYPVQVGALEDAPAPEDPYDLVVGWMVLEHLHDPVRCLEKLRSWVRPDGWLVLSVPDASAAERRIFADAWYALSLPTHLFHYTPATLRAMLRRGGWEAQRFIWQANPNNALHSMRYRCLDRGWGGAANFLDSVLAGRRLARTRFAIGKLLGAARASGRMTVWARPATR